MLSEAGVDCARQEVGIVLRRVTRQATADFYAGLQRTITTTEAEAIAGIIDRRLQREPLQYILNSAFFYGREFYVDPSVLIPRPETELLVDTLLDAFPSAWKDSPPLFADLGAGSGVIGVSLACEATSARVVAIDSSLPALRVARRNAGRHGVADRLSFICSDLLMAMNARFDAIVANPPYIPSAVISNLDPEIVHFEPHQALDGGPDGLNIIRRVCSQAATALKQGGRLLLEVGAGQSTEVLKTMREADCWDTLTAVPDLTGIPRVISARLAGVDRIIED